MLCPGREISTIKWFVNKGLTNGMLNPGGFTLIACTNKDIYEGKKNLPTDLALARNDNLRILTGRVQLSRIIPNVIAFMHSKGNVRAEIAHHNIAASRTVGGTPRLVYFEPDGNPAYGNFVWNNNPSEAISTIASMPKHERKSWCMLYCGGRNNVYEGIKMESKRLKIKVCQRHHSISTSPFLCRLIICISILLE